jgi:hypothetical protein
VDAAVATAALLESIAQIIVSALLIAVLWQLVRVLESLRGIAERLRRGSELLERDMLRARQKIIAESFNISATIKTLLRAFAPLRRRSKKEGETTAKDSSG